MSLGQDIVGQGTERIIIDATGAADGDALTYDADAKAFKPAAGGGGGSFTPDAELGDAETFRASAAAGAALRGDAGTDYVYLRDDVVIIASGAGDVTIQAGEDLTIAGTTSLSISTAEGQVSSTGEMVLEGTPLSLRHDGSPIIETGASDALGFYGATPVSKQTGVAVNIAAVHAALVALGLIGA